ncbi:Endoribonuclease L-PSP/chorismate mutase-like protein [Paraphoma chrysanthemicola]|uniref:Endoribonuclease L-PSP/chorismate mutase-like protein n=1 Tax=Paraphoma chrysanthemicola TaxID=798071 RepID=A0A8K0QSH9_9PLEO|nr:Endoribonuclease L-PSP/chorismate mutase-like protein [Paraphoma chrysanthemicola]
MSRTPVLSKEAPAPSPHLSQAIVYNGMVYCSGALGIHPQTRKLAGGAYEQTKQALKNLDAILREAGTQSTNTVKTTIFLSSMEHYAEVNKAYLEFFSGDAKPSRTCVAVAQLPLAGADVEIEAIAGLPQTPAPKTSHL